MPNSQKRLLDQDPDYESIPLHAQQKRIKLHEQDAKEATIKKIEQIIKTQFSEEISTRESELDTINQRIYQAQLLLDRLRVSIITKYYATNGQEAKLQSDADAHQTASVHPTTKKFLGKSVPSFLPKQHTTNHGLGAPTSIQEQRGTSKDPADNTRCQASKTVPERTQENPTTVRGIRYKNKIRVIVGNVSKYISSDKRDPNDHSTHKWMVYVRCPPGDPDISSLVHKVRFFLHPSYRPNDLVEVTEAPFHLVRKGWGEFPLRVQLHFRDRWNKPVDVIHNLKLDKTYTGLQTLGAETVVDLSTCSSSEVPTKEHMETHSSPLTTPGPVEIESKGGTSQAEIFPAPEIESDLLKSKNELSVEKLAAPATETLNTRDDAVKVHTHSHLNPCVEQPKAVQQRASVSVPHVSPASAVQNSNQATSLLVKREPSATTSATTATILPGRSLLIPNGVPPNKAKPSTPVIPISPNGLTAPPSFVKCTDSLGRVLLVPTTSLLRPTSALPNGGPPNIRPATSLLASNVNNVPQATAPTASPAAVLPQPPTYTLLVLPKVNSVQTQIVLVPTNSLKTKEPTADPKDPRGPDSVVAPPQQNVPLSPDRPSESTNVANLLQKKLDSLRLKDLKDLKEAIFAVAALFPLVGVTQAEKMACFPYAATDSDTFFSWPQPKQRASEWLRASDVRRALLKLIECQQPPWHSSGESISRKKLMILCRRFGFTPLHHNVDYTQSEEKHFREVSAGGTYSEPRELMSSLAEAAVRAGVLSKLPEVEEDIDIERVEQVEQRNSSRSPDVICSPLKATRPARVHLPLSPCAQFVKEAASEVGVYMTSTEIEPGVDAPVVEEMVLSVSMHN